MSKGKIAIIGAGPIGLETALYARTLGYDVSVYEQGSIANNVKSWGFVQLFSPWPMNVTTLGRKTLASENAWQEPGATACPTGAEYVERYLRPLATSRLLRDCIRQRTSVISIGRDDFWKGDAIGKTDRTQSPFRFLIRDLAGRERTESADFAIDCSGTYGVHRWAGRGGVPSPGERMIGNRIRYTIPDVLGEDRARYADRHTLLIGCGYSAATALFNLAKLAEAHPKTRVSWAIRRVGQAMESIADDRLPLRRQLVLRSLELSEHPPAWLQFLGTSVLEEVHASDRLSVTMNQLQTSLSLEVDEIVALVGYRPDDSIYEQLQVHQCYASHGPIKLAAALLGEAGADCLTAGAGLSADLLKNPEPNFYILGSKSFGTNSSFLLQTGHTQVRDVFKLISGDPSLDLYAHQP